MLMCFKTCKQIRQPIYYVLHRSKTAYIQPITMNTINHEHQSVHYSLLIKISLCLYTVLFLYSICTTQTLAITGMLLYK